MTAAGDVVPVTAIDDLRGSMIGRHTRTTTSSTSTGTEVGVVRLDGLAFVTGRNYEIGLGPVVVNSTVAGDLLEIRCRIDLTTTATTTSTHHGSLGQDSKSASSAQRLQGMIWPFTPASTATGSVLISMLRSTGTGTCSLLVPSAPYYIRVWVRDCGADPGDTGVDI